MKKALLLIFTSYLFFISCSSSIDGNVTDNFNQPLHNVDIKIENSAYTTTSNSSGQFSLDYKAGSFKLLIEKEGYLSHTIELNVTDKSGYNLGKVELIKVPEKAGVYYISDSKYIEIPKMKLETIKDKNCTSYLSPDKSSLVKLTDSAPKFMTYGLAMPLTSIGLEKEGVLAQRCGIGFISTAGVNKQKFDRKPLASKIYAISTELSESGVYTLASVYPEKSPKYVHEDFYVFSFEKE